MAKITVIDSREQTQAPFLRGILTRSLQDAGLAFPEAYQLASTIRQEFGDSTEITTDQLRSAVLRHLHNTDAAEQVLQRYRRAPFSPAPILVRDTGGHVTPFSRAYQQRALETCGLPAEQAAVVIQPARAARATRRFAANRSRPPSRSPP